MKELALHLGGTAEALGRSMSEREFRSWMGYSNERGLPWERFELYMAQLTMWVARSMGGNFGMTLKDFILMGPNAASSGDGAEEPTVEEAREAFQFRPRKRKEKAS